ncbi:MAG: hypothetical protein RLZZ157_1162 [Pseudomonadota bacterium]|jgi:hypothetical protein
MWVNACQSPMKWRLLHLGKRSWTAFGDRSAHTKACLNSHGLDQARQGTRCALYGLDPLAQTRALFSVGRRLSGAVKDGAATAKRGHAVASLTDTDRHSTINTAFCVQGRAFTKTRPKPLLMAQARPVFGEISTGIIPRSNPSAWAEAIAQGKMFP